MICPAPPKLVDPAAWADDLTLYAATVLLEAEGEPDEGKVAVAWVIRNRMDSRKQTVRQVILAPYQFSCWNADYTSQRKARLIAPDPLQWERCWRAACGAGWRLVPDPTHGAQHYYNPDYANPSWAAGAKKQRIGRHLFLSGVR